MIYDSLDILPIKTFFKIQETNNISLLATANELFEVDELQKTFDKLSDDFQMMNTEDNSARNFMLLKEISHLESKYKTAICGIEILRFEANTAIIHSLSELLNIKIRTNQTNFYYKDLDRAQSKANLLKRSIEKLRDQLPKTKPESNKSIDDVLASVSMITGVSFDFNAISCTAYLALLNQAKIKTKSQEERINKMKFN